MGTFEDTIARLRIDPVQREAAFGAATKPTATRPAIYNNDYAGRGQYLLDLFTQGTAAVPAGAPAGTPPTIQLTEGQLQIADLTQPTVERAASANNNLAKAVGLGLVGIGGLAAVTFVIPQISGNESHVRDRAVINQIQANKFRTYSHGRNAPYTMTRQDHIKKASDGRNDGMDVMAGASAICALIAAGIGLYLLRTA